MADVGVWSIDGDAPRRVSRAGVGLERDLEDWIARDASLLADGLTIVGRQVRLDGGPLDLLAIDWRDRWVVIELKRERLYRTALAQALDYTSSIAQMEAGDLEELLRARPRTAGRLRGALPDRAAATRWRGRRPRRGRPPRRRRRGRRPRAHRGSPRRLRRADHDRELPGLRDHGGLAPAHPRGHRGGHPASAPGGETVQRRGHPAACAGGRCRGAVRPLPRYGTRRRARGETVRARRHDRASSEPRPLPHVRAARIGRHRSQRRTGWVRGVLPASDRGGGDRRDWSV